MSAAPREELRAPRRLGATPGGAHGSGRARLGAADGRRPRHVVAVFVGGAGARPDAGRRDVGAATLAPLLAGRGALGPADAGLNRAGAR